MRAAIFGDVGFLAVRRRAARRRDVARRRVPRARAIARAADRSAAARTHSPRAAVRFDFARRRPVRGRELPADRSDRDVLAERRTRAHRARQHARPASRDQQFSPRHGRRQRVAARGARAPAAGQGRYGDGSSALGRRCESQPLRTHAGGNYVAADGLPEQRRLRLLRDARHSATCWARVRPRPQ